jgi:iron complex outermembrane receptor protein
VAISAFSAEDLKQNDVRRLNELTRSVPNLQFDNAIGTANSARIYLRGVGTGDPISSRDPGVGIYVDGAYLPRQQSSLLTLSDIERVEVLRGPQGTLFGKKTIGGAISITSKKPDIGGDFGADTEFRAGNFGRFDSRISFDIPLVDEKAAARVSFATATRDTVVKNKGTGPDLQDDKLLAGRIQLRFEPTDSLSFNFSYDQSRENRKPQGGKCVVVNRKGSTPTTAGGNNEMGMDRNGNGVIENAAAALAFSTVVGSQLAQQGALLGPQGSAGTNANNRFFNSCAQDGVRDNRSVASNVSFYGDSLRTRGSIGNIELQLSDNLTLKSITGYRHNDTLTRGDLDYTELNLLDATSEAGGGRQSSISQELQLVGSALDDKFNYVVGGFAFHENNYDRSYGGVATKTNLLFSGNQQSATQTRLNSLNQGSATSQFRGRFLTDTATQNAYRNSVFTTDGGADRLVTQADIDATNAARAVVEPLIQQAMALNSTLTAAAATAQVIAQLNMDPANAATVGAFNRLYALPGAMTQVVLKTRNTSFAAFTQGTYDITDKLSATAGLRFTAEKKFVDNEIIAFKSGVIGGNARQEGEVDFAFARSARFTDFSPMANLSYQATDDMFFYATYSKAFKSGGFNGRANVAALTNEIDDEELTAYEVGFKTKWLDNRLVINGAAYLNRYKSIQLTIPAGGANQAVIQILNVGKNDIKGSELEIVAIPLAGLQLTASGGIIAARYTEFDDPTSSRANDRDLPASPTYTYNLGAAYEFPLGSLGDLRLRTEWAARGNSATDVVNTKELDRSKSGELSAGITLALADGVTEVGLFGKNLLNREYFINGVSLDASLGHAYRFYNEPRQYGIELRRSF